MSTVVGDQALAVVGVGQVGGHDDGSVELGGQRLQPVGPPGGQHDLRADGVEHPGEAGAEARRGPGDDGHLAVEAEQAERIERVSSWAGSVGRDRRPNFRCSSARSCR